MAAKNFPLTGFSSVGVHGGHQNDPLSSHLTPIYATSTFTFDNAEQGMRRFANKEEGYIYTRWGNPNFTEAEAKIAAFESLGITHANGSPLQLKAFLHSSGQAAMTTLFLSNLQQGDKVLSHYSLYGGTHELLHKILPPMGIEIIIEDLRDLNKAEAVFKNNPGIKWMHLETPANPTIQCVDIEELTTLAKKYNTGVSVDNTFATPYLQQPFRYGVDYVFHSTTKFLNGHGTAIGGVLLGKDLEFMNTKMTKWYRLLGGNSNAFDAYLLTLGMKTLELRMERHCHNAMEIAHYLQDHPAVAQVNYNGLPDHPDYYVSAKQMRHPGPMMSMELKDGLTAGKKFTDGLIRMSIGIENVQDILADLEQALQ
ncbi:MAG: cystathionine gamma-synthase [Sphingobacteriales bacterium]|nr:MAG: cystathionine gamma-synthase [Sphingobacteriales bacterium]